MRDGREVDDRVGRDLGQVAGEPVVVAGVLVVGRAVELSSAASAIAKFAIPARAGFAVRLTGLLVIAALLSAFMNNIAALVITMPIASEKNAKIPTPMKKFDIVFIVKSLIRISTTSRGRAFLSFSFSFNFSFSFSHASFAAFSSSAPPS